MKKAWVGLLFLLCFIGAEPVFGWGSRLKPDQFVMFLPGLAVEQADGSFKVDVDAWVFEKDSRRITISALAAWMGIDIDKLPPEQKKLFTERIRYFRTDSERGKRLLVRLADQVFALPRTKGSGRVHGKLNVGRKWVNWDEGPGRTGWVEWALEAPGHPLHGQGGRAWAIPAEGVSIVSDIDDTIKISHVQHKKTLIRNTLLEPFQAVPGMAGWYQEMARNGHLSDANPDSGFAREPVIFHYLSAGPLQLYPVLSEFLKDAHFPEGILHLRESTSMRTLYAGRKTTIAHKKAVLTRLFETYPQRKFILIGDSGENDPEIYADIARSYPGRVLAIHIRNVTDEGRAAPRYQQTFTGIEPQTWHIRD